MSFFSHLLLMSITTSAFWKSSLFTNKKEIYCTQNNFMGFMLPSKSIDLPSFPPHSQSATFLFIIFAFSKESGEQFSEEFCIELHCLFGPRVKAAVGYWA
jgi:hypothetical protein